MSESMKSELRKLPLNELRKRVDDEEKALQRERAQLLVSAGEL